MEFPNEQELTAMKGIMDGEESVSKQHLKYGLQKIGAKSNYDLILWGLRAGIIKDPPLPEVKKHAMANPKKYHEGYPMWLQYLSGIVSGYSPSDIEQEMHIGKDSQDFYFKKIAIDFHLHPSKSRLIRFAFQVLSPISPPPTTVGFKPFKPWNGSTTSLMTVPKKGTGSRIDPESSITRKTVASKALKFLGVVGSESQKKNPWDMLELAKHRRDDEILRLYPIANSHPETAEVKMASKQLAVVNAAWGRVKILFARKGYALPGDEELLRREKRIFIPGKKH
jgi:hypothetical protein